MSEHVYGKLTEDHCWEIVEDLNWPENCRQNVDILKKNAVDKYGFNTMLTIHKFVSDKSSQLYNYISRFEYENGVRCGQYGGDDSFEDMISHAVSMGRKYYESVREDPTILNELDYVEKFSYILPYENDREYFDEYYYVAYALRNIDSLYLLMMGTKLPEASIKIVDELVDRFDYMQQGNFEKACEGFNQQMYDRYCKFEGNTEMARYSNTLSDCMAYMLGLDCKNPPPPKTFLTFDEIVDDLIISMAEAEAEGQEEFINCQKDDLVMYHHGLGQHIRNKYNLWAETNPLTMLNYKKQIIDGVDMNPKHPDAVSMRIIEELQKRLKNDTH